MRHIAYCQFTILSWWPLCFSLVIFTSVSNSPLNRIQISLPKAACDDFPPHLHYSVLYFRLLCMLQRWWYANAFAPLIDRTLWRTLCVFQKSIVLWAAVKGHNFISSKNSKWPFYSTSAWDCSEQSCGFFEEASCWMHFIFQDSLHPICSGILKGIHQWGEHLLLYIVTFAVAVAVVIASLCLDSTGLFLYSKDRLKYIFYNFHNLNIFTVV